LSAVDLNRQQNRFAGPPLPEMSAEYALELVKLFDELQLEVVVDGGWAVDALLGQQTRAHSDLDIAIAHKSVPQLRQALEARGYTDVLLGDTTEYNFVLEDGFRHRVDSHIYSFDEQGRLVYGLPYPFDSLDGQGTILGYPVRCITPAWLVQFHTGYKLDENDYHDVRLLCQRFGIELPAEYTGFRKDG